MDVACYKVGGWIQYTWDFVGRGFLPGMKVCLALLGCTVN